MKRWLVTLGNAAKVYGNVVIDAEFVHVTESGALMIKRGTELERAYAPGVWRSVGTVGATDEQAKKEAPPDEDP